MYQSRLYIIKERNVRHNMILYKSTLHDYVIKWKHFARYWPFVLGIHRPPMNSTHQGQWRGALIFSLICAWINASVNNREASDLRCHRGHYDVIVMSQACVLTIYVPYLTGCQLWGFEKTLTTTLQFVMNSYDIFTNILQGCFTGIEIAHSLGIVAIPKL